MLRIWYVYSGSEFFHSGSRIQGQKDSGSRIRLKEFKNFKPKKSFLGSRKYNPGCSSGSGYWFFTDPGSRGLKRHRIPDPDPQHWIKVRIGVGVPGAGELEPAAAGPGDRTPGGQEQGVRLHSPPSDSSGTQSPVFLQFLLINKSFIIPGLRIHNDFMRIQIRISCVNSTVTFYEIFKRYFFLTTVGWYFMDLLRRLIIFKVKMSKRAPYFRRLKYLYFVFNIKMHLFYTWIRIQQLILMRIRFGSSNSY